MADEVAGDVDRADEDNRVLASLGNLAPPLNAATLPSPATSEVAQLVEGARTSGFGASEADIPDGVPAWTQQCGTALQDQMSASMDWVHAQCEVRARAFRGCSRERAGPMLISRPRLSPAPSTLAQGEQAAGSLHACSATGPASKHVRASLDTAAGAHKRQLHSEGEGSKLSALIANACSSDVKWLLITHAATLIVGVYFGHAWSSASSSKSTVCAPSTGAREALPQPRVA